MREKGGDEGQHWASLVGSTGEDVIGLSQDGFGKEGSRHNLRDKIRTRGEGKCCQEGTSAGTKVWRGQCVGFSEGGRAGEGGQRSETFALP